MVSTLDFSRCRIAPFAHQREDVATLLEHPWFFIASEMRTGKSAIVVLASQFLFEQNIIDRVIIIAPAPVRNVWYDPELGELAKHLWSDLPARVVEYHDRTQMWTYGGEATRQLEFIVTNYEYLVVERNLADLLPLATSRTLLVLDESSFVKSHDAARTKACFQLRKQCGRVVLLNGTPIFHSPMDLFTQANMLHESVINCKYVTHFKARYAVQEPILDYRGRPLTKVVGKGRFAKEIIIQKVTGWRDLDQLQESLAPVTVRRLQAECLDLPPKLDPVNLTATLTPDTWKIYNSMRKELVVWFEKQVSLSSTAAVKALRLSQITSGILGGVEDPNILPKSAKTLLDSLILPGLYVSEPPPVEEGEDLEPVNNFRVISREKIDVLLWFMKQKLEADPNLHLVAWSRFRLEAEQAYFEVQKHFPQFQCAMLMGSQTKSARHHALSLLKPETSPSGPVFVAGVEGTGSFGLDMTASHTCVTMSSGYSPGLSKQTLDRVYGPNQKHPIAYYEIIAIGPKGQRTIDHDIVTARRNSEDIALRTSAAWVKALTSE